MRLLQCDRCVGQLAEFGKLSTKGAWRRAGAVRLLQPPAPGLALAIPLQLHFAECLWELPLLEVLVHLAAQHAWPDPVQARSGPSWLACTVQGGDAGPDPG